MGIEVDGETHRLTAQKARDAEKEAFLIDRGWTVLRFTNEQVRDSLPACVAAITTAVENASVIWWALEP